jgi:hypothetical protein
MKPGQNLEAIALTYVALAVAVGGRDLLQAANSIMRDAVDAGVVRSADTKQMISMMEDIAAMSSV